MAVTGTNGYRDLLRTVPRRRQNLCRSGCRPLSERAATASLDEPGKRLALKRRAIVQKTRSLKKFRLRRAAGKIARIVQRSSGASVAAALRRCHRHRRDGAALRRDQPKHASRRRRRRGLLVPILSTPTRTSPALNPRLVVLANRPRLDQSFPSYRARLLPRLRVLGYVLTT